MRLHHVGFVVASIEGQVEGFARSLNACWDDRIVHDPIQKVRVAFLQMSNPTEPQVELVEPASEDSPVAGFLARGGGLHHLCYETPDLDALLNRLRAQGAVVVKRPRPAAAFNGRRIAWVHTAQKLLLEFLEA